MDRNRGFGEQVPVKVGDELDVNVEAVGEKGDGVAKKDGFVIFVPGAKEGQTVRIRVTRVLRKMGFGEIVGDAAAADSPEQPEEGSQKTPEAEAEPEPVEDSEDFGEESEEEKQQ